MDWENFEKMDPHMLVGVVNTEIRNNCGSIEELCIVHGIEQEAITEKLNKAGYQYREELRQFR
jgi:hypothetical protein